MKAGEGEASSASHFTVRRKFNCGPLSCRCQDTAQPLPPGAPPHRSAAWPPTSHSHSFQSQAALFECIKETCVSCVCVCAHVCVRMCVCAHACSNSSALVGVSGGPHFLTLPDIVCGSLMFSDPANFPSPALGGVYLPSPTPSPSPWLHLGCCERWWFPWIYVSLWRHALFCITPFPRVDCFWHTAL